MRRIILIVVLLVGGQAAHAQADELPLIVGHRGLMRHAPENTRAGFAVCINLRLGFELDIRRSKDGALVLIHDDDVKRTTSGTGKVSSFTFAELRKLDAGAWFSPAFKDERVPTLEEAFLMLKERADILAALDIKVEDETLAGEVVALAKKHGVLPQVMCIGLTIENPKLRAGLRAADAKTPVAVLANQRDDLAKALADKHADWIYVRFMPTAAEVKGIHSQNKRVFLVGKLVAGNEPDAWRRAAAAGVDALLTDYPLECRDAFRALKEPRTK